MDNQLKTITGLTVFIIIGLCCASGIIAGPVFAPYVPDCFNLALKILGFSAKLMASGSLM
jgi:hypothetical protein